MLSPFFWAQRFLFGTVRTQAPFLRANRAVQEMLSAARALRQAHGYVNVSANPHGYSIKNAV
jgi:hypothetical protein